MITGANQILVNTGVPNTTLLSSQSLVATGSAVQLYSTPKIVQATVSGSGAVNAVVNIYGSVTNSNTAGVLIATLQPTGTNTGQDGAYIPSPWPYMYADVTVLASGASVSVTVGQ